LKQAYLRAIGEVSDEDLSAIQSGLEQRLELKFQRLTPLPDPAHAFDARRRQYNSPVLVKDLLDQCPDGAFRVIGITERDLFIPMLSFVFGQAQLKGRIALVSLARLRQEFYGLVPDRAVFLDRAIKEVVHEAGHTFGLVHCQDRACPMSLSTDIRQVDAKTAQYCRACAEVARAVCMEKY
jgi:archaemetzincin